MEVRLEGIVKKFQGTKTRPDTVAVDSMTLTIPDGKLVGLLGPSGCGKSTTLYMIAGLHKPTEGKIWFGETDVTNVPPEKRGIGLVFQNYALYPHLTVRQNIMFPLENIRPKMPKEEMNAVAQEMADLVDIGQYMHRKPKELSGGQQQRVAIARALAKKPQVLLLDEPLSNLDARLRLQTREEIRRIQRETGITTIFVTHDQEEAMSISDEIVVMKAGVIQQIGEPQYVYDEPANLFVAKFLGSPAINVFNGNLKAGKLYINDDLLDESGYEAKGEMKIDSPEAYDVFVGLGYTGKLDEYQDLLYNFVEPVVENAGEENAEPVEAAPAPKKRGRKPSVTVKEVVYRMGVKGFAIDEQKAIDALDNAKTELKVERGCKVGVRPEQFVLDPKGAIEVEVSHIETIGRDISVVGHIAKQNDKIRIIISSELRGKVKVGEINRFSTKRFYVFENNGTRIK